MTTEKQQELLNDVTNSCGCYQMGDSCYDKQGDYTHDITEKCND